MVGALWILLATVVMGGILYIHHRFLSKKTPENTEELQQSLPDDTEECCGQHAICEKDSLLSGVSSKIEYYDDEELDSYKGFTAEMYSEDQIEQFRDVLYTLQPDDVAGWYRSIQLRQIELPTVISDELFLLISEKRGI